MRGGASLVSASWFPGSLMSGILSVYLKKIMPARGPRNDLRLCESAPRLGSNFSVFSDRAKL